ncbi:hypothetical protein WJX82_010324 [Trebouxia sp. C0006]
MPEVYDAQEVAAMLTMVQAAMQHKSQQLHLERTASLQMQQQVDGLQESLENMSYLFAQEQQHRLAPVWPARNLGQERQQIADGPGRHPEAASQDCTAERYATLLTKKWRAHFIMGVPIQHGGSFPKEPRSGPVKDSRLQAVSFEAVSLKDRHHES